MSGTSVNQLLNPLRFDSLDVENEQKFDKELNWEMQIDKSSANQF